MSTLKTNKVQVGQSGTASQNFVLRNNNDGTFRISRGNAGAETGDVLTINADGTVTGDIIAGLGVGQTWQDVTVSRANGVTYTNTTGRVIGVMYEGASTGASAANLTINGLAIRGGGAPASLQTGSGVFIVPAGATYLASGITSITKWLELR